jgi:hypothetical protein
MSLSPADLVTPTKPWSCALILGLPLSSDDFEADLKLNTARDYSRNHLQLGRNASEAWEEDGEPIAAAANELADFANSLGVHVYRAGSLESVSSAFAAHTVVTLVAHWRASELRRSDFLTEPEQLIKRILSGTDQFSLRVADRLDRRELEAALSGSNFADRAGAIAELLNEVVINSDDPLSGVSTGSEVIYRPWLQLQHRQMLDEAFPDLLRPGNLIELRDGLHSATTICDRIPSRWSGIVDLAMCSSTLAAKIIKNAYPDRRVISSKNQVVPQIRLRVLRELYRRIAINNVNYATELTLIVRNMRDLSGSIRQAIREGKWEHD